MAKSEPIFRSLGKEIDNSIYFTIFTLATIAKSFKVPIRYDRTKVAIKVYNKLSEKGLVIIKNIEGTIHIAITKKGDDESEVLLDDLWAYMDNDSEDRFVAK